MKDLFNYLINLIRLAIDTHIEIAKKLEEKYNKKE